MAWVGWLWSLVETEQAKALFARPFLTNKKCKDNMKKKKDNPNINFRSLKLSVSYDLLKRFNVTFLFFFL